MHRFLAWLGDVACGLGAYVLSRWIWDRDGDGVFRHLPEELATFAGLYLLLRLSLKGVGAVRRKKKAERAAAKAAAKAVARVAPR